MASALTTSPASRSARARARSDLPLAVGPTTARAGRSPAAALSRSGRARSATAPEGDGPADAVGLAPEQDIPQPHAPGGGTGHQRPQVGAVRPDLTGQLEVNGCERTAVPVLQRVGDGVVERPGAGVLGAGSLGTVAR